MDFQFATDEVGLGGSILDWVEAAGLAFGG